MEKEPFDRYQTMAEFAQDMEHFLLGEAIAKEISRGGQIFFVHNRVKDIEKVWRPIEEKAWAEQATIEAEAVAQALCMETEDFARAFRAFAAKQKPVFEGN